MEILILITFYLKLNSVLVWAAFVYRRASLQIGKIVSVPLESLCLEPFEYKMNEQIPPSKDEIYDTFSPFLWPKKLVCSERMT